MNSISVDVREQQVASGRTIAHHSPIAEVIPRTRFMSPELVHSLDERAPGFAELYHAGLEVVERPFYEAILLLVMGEEIVPQRVLLGCQSASR